MAKKLVRNEHENAVADKAERESAREKTLDFLKKLTGNKKLMEELAVTIRFGKTCKNCGEKFQAVRPEAHTCSTRCRVALHRKQKA